MGGYVSSGLYEHWFNARERVIMALEPPKQLSFKALKRLGGAYLSARVG